MAHRSPLLRALIFSACICASSFTHAAGFQISEVSVSGLGRAFAGAGIGGESISDMFSNPASLGLRSGSEFEIGAHILSTTADFENQGSNQTFLTPTGALTLPSSGINSDAGETAVIPNLYLSGDITERLRYGIGLTAPFGLTTDYDPNWVGRFAAIRSELITVEINPSLSYSFGNTSIGAGITITNADAELTNAQFTGLGSPDALATVEGDDTSIGFTLGIISENETGRIGVGYRSEVTLDVEGSLSISPLGVNAGAVTEVTLPQTLYVSGLLKARPNLDLLASLRFTDWECI